MNAERQEPRPGDDPAVPAFERARTRRQMARAAGLHPDHWYAVEHSHALRPGAVIETRFWQRSIALFRGQDGTIGAVENRCAHRQVKLSLGEVAGCRLVCPYHGWQYDTAGRLVAIPHALFGQPMPRVRLAAFPVRERYGLIWLFPGDPALAEATGMPEIPEVEGARPWAAITVDFTWAAHHSMIIENVSDFTHAHLHRSYRPFTDATLIELRTEGQRVRLAYDVLVGDGRFSKHFVDRSRVRVDRMELCFEYPYQWSDTGGRIKHWCFFLPMDARTTRVFFLFYFDAIQIPLLRVPMPRWLQLPLLRAARRVMIRPLLAQDGGMVEAEQQAYERRPHAPSIELNPAVIAFQKLVVAEWRRHLEGAMPRTAAPAELA